MVPSGSWLSLVRILPPSSEVFLTTIRAISFDYLLYGSLGLDQAVACTAHNHVTRLVLVSWRSGYSHCPASFSPSPESRAYTYAYVLAEAEKLKSPFVASAYSIIGSWILRHLKEALAVEKNVRRHHGRHAGSRDNQVCRALELDPRFKPNDDDE